MRKTIFIAALLMASSQLFSVTVTFHHFTRQLSSNSFFWQTAVLEDVPENSTQVRMTSSDQVFLFECPNAPGLYFQGSSSSIPGQVLATGLPTDSDQFTIYFILSSIDGQQLVGTNSGVVSTTAIIPGNEITFTFMDSNGNDISSFSATVTDNAENLLQDTDFLRLVGC